ncbi:hypothetical protein EJB05_54620, partial [Eragrostis curvula]
MLRPSIPATMLRLAVTALSSLPPPEDEKPQPPIALRHRPAAGAPVTAINIQCEQAIEAEKAAPLGVSALDPEAGGRTAAKTEPLGIGELESGAATGPEEKQCGIGDNACCLLRLEECGGRPWEG